MRYTDRRILYFTLLRVQPFLRDTLMTDTDRQTDRQAGRHIAKNTSLCIRLAQASHKKKNVNAKTPWKTNTRRAKIAGINPFHFRFLPGNSLPQILSNAVFKTFCIS